MPVHLSRRQWGNRGPSGTPARASWYCATCGCENAPRARRCKTIGCGGTAAPAPGAGHRTDGYQAKRRAWVCVSCRAWHDAKPRTCINPECGNAATRKEKRFLNFDSKGEGLRFLRLWSWQDYGEIRPGTLVHHPRYALMAPAPGGNGPPVSVAVYEADAAYVRADGTAVVEDFKPPRAEALDPVFKLKRRWFTAQHAPLTITLVH